MFEFSIKFWNNFVRIIWVVWIATKKVDLFLKFNGKLWVLVLFQFSSIRFKSIHTNCSLLTGITIDSKLFWNCSAFSQKADPYNHFIMCITFLSFKSFNDSLKTLFIWKQECKCKFQTSFLLKFHPKSFWKSLQHLKFSLNFMNHCIIKILKRICSNC